MYQYQAIFKDVNDKWCYVTLTPTAGYTETKELTLAGDSPVVITQESDGIFTPVKTKGCTITILTDEILWDLYSKSPFDWEVKVVKSGVSTLFLGYLTPCVYTQDYVYKGTIELEAVDCLATLENIKYSLVESGKYQFVTVKDLVNTMLKKIPYYSSVTSPCSFNYYPWNFLNCYVQEANFFDDDDEPMTCKEILEELGNYLGVTFTMYGEYVRGFSYPNLNSTITTLDKDLYASGPPSIEIDEVYNKISIGCSLQEVDKLTTDIFDNSRELINGIKKYSDGDYLYSKDSWSFRYDNHHTVDTNRYKFWFKMYDFCFADFAATDTSKYKASQWQSHWYNIKDKTLLDTTVSNLATKNSKEYGSYCDVDSSSGNIIPIFTPMYSGGYPMRQYQYTVEDGIESLDSIAWTDYLVFPTMYYNGGGYMPSTYKAITFKNTKHLPYSLSGTGNNGYICFKGSAWFQIDTTIKDGSVAHTAYTDVKNVSTLAKIEKGPIFMPCLANISKTSRWEWSDLAKREEGDSEYNTGFNAFKAMLRIGDKYYNGTSWTATESTFNLRMHQESVESGAEYLTAMKWNKFAANPSDTTNYTEDSFAIPILPSDKLSGDLELTLYVPYQSWNRDKKTVTNVYLKDFKVEYEHMNAASVIDDIEEDDDIVYENIIDTTYAIDMEELDLKINSYYDGKPISTSYLLDANKRPIITANGQPQEQNLIDMYYNHYSTPKKKFTINYHLDVVSPFNRFKHPTLGGSGVTMVVDSYEQDVKANTIELNLIEL